MEMELGTKVRYNIGIGYEKERGERKLKICVKYSKKLSASLIAHILIFIQTF
jgi:hypothetical protein